MRVLIAEPDEDVRLLLELLVARLGHEPVRDGVADAVVLEPSCPVAHAQLQQFGDDVPPVICLSIYPRGPFVLEPPETVEYLLKPASAAQLGAALDGAIAA